jgi:hypothetical protein
VFLPRSQHTTGAALRRGELRAAPLSLCGIETPSYLRRKAQNAIDLVTARIFDNRAKASIRIGDFLSEPESKGAAIQNTRLLPG